MSLNIISPTPLFVLATAPGFEPANNGAKIRCLTAWRYPNDGRGESPPKDTRKLKISNSFAGHWMPGHLAYLKHSIAKQLRNN